MVIRSRFGRAALCLAILAMALSGCNDSTTQNFSTSSTTTPPKNPLSPLRLQQFANAFVEIPIAPKDAVNPNRYTVAVRQGSWDFGLRNSDGSEIMDSATGRPIAKTKTWGYDINGVFLGVYGPTVEAVKGVPLTFKYSNDLRAEVNGVKGTGPYLTKHLLPIDPTIDGTNMGEPECRIVTHLHGGDVAPESDGHPDSWVANDPSVQALWAAPADPVTGFPGRAATNHQPDYVYPNSQEACTLWFHDHAMGITRLNAYAGVAAFYLIKDNAVDNVVSGTAAVANLPKGRYPNPVAPSLQSDEFDLPVVLQDKSFTEDGSLAFPTFGGLGGYSYGGLRDSSGNAITITRPEMFGNVITVNGKAWPYKTVKTQAYRFRFVNGSDSRTYNIWLQDADSGQIITPAVATAAAPSLTWPIVQIAAEQGYADTAVDVATGPGADGLLIPNGSRADIVIDFAHPVFKGRNIIVRNDCPAPFSGGFGPEAEDMNTLDPKTTGKIMMFKVANTTGTPSPLFAAAGPESSLRTGIVPYGSYPSLTPTREAGPRYVDFQERKDPVFAFLDPTTGLVFYRTQLLLNNRLFTDPITEKIFQDDVEEWVMINTTPDVHPMHVHLVKFEVIEKGYIDTVNFPGSYHRADAVAMPFIDNTSALVPSAEPGQPANSAGATSVYRVAPNERAVWKDTVMVPPAGTPFDSGVNVAYPGYTKIRARFSRLGTYMWHCHILSHEENDMMRPFMVIPSGD